MATKLENNSLEIAHFNNFRKYIPRSGTMCQKTLNHLLKIGVIQVSTAFEHALARAGGHELISKDCGDLIKNGVYSDAKLSTVRIFSCGKSYGAPVTNIFNKKGSLRVQVYERIQEQFYYFVIPHRAYKHIPKSSNIDIPFEMDGTPKTKNHWWRWQVDSFKVLATK
jgi:hypothetical protein